MGSGCSPDPSMSQKPLVTWVLIWVARCGKLWALSKESMLRQQGSPQQGVLSFVLADPAGWTVSSWRAGLGLSLPLCPHGTQHMVAAQ